MPEPPTEISTTIPVNSQGRLGKPRKNPIIEHHKQLVMVQSGKLKTSNLRFPHAVTPRTNNPKSFFHPSTYEQSPDKAVSETIWFNNNDPIYSSEPNSANYNPLSSFLNWAKIPYESKLHTLHIEPFGKLQHRHDFIPPIPSENTQTVKYSTKNLGGDKTHQSLYPTKTAL